MITLVARHRCGCISLAIAEDSDTEEVKEFYRTVHRQHLSAHKVEKQPGQRLDWNCGQTNGRCELQLIKDKRHAAQANESAVRRARAYTGAKP